MLRSRGGGARLGSRHTDAPAPTLPTLPRPQRRRKDELERRLAEIEEAARVFSRSRVLVKA
jgi:hypothetical protein